LHSSTLISDKILQALDAPLISDCCVKSVIILCQSISIYLLVQDQITICITGDCAMGDKSPKNKEKRKKKQATKKEQKKTGTVTSTTRP